MDLEFVGKVVETDAGASLICIRRHCGLCDLSVSWACGDKGLLGLVNQKLEVRVCVVRRGDVISSRATVREQTPKTLPTQLEAIDICASLCREVLFSLLPRQSLGS